MKKRYIWFWHGINSDHKLIKKISKFCQLELYKGEQYYMFEGSLDDFEKLYNDKFIVVDDFIGVTQHSSFGQR